MRYDSATEVDRANGRTHGWAAAWVVLPPVLFLLVMYVTADASQPAPNQCGWFCMSEREGVQFLGVVSIPFVVVALVLGQLLAFAMNGLGRNLPPALRGFLAAGLADALVVGGLLASQYW